MKELTDGVSWIHNCYEHRGRHVHISVYLVKTPDGSILIDSGSFYHRDEIRSQVREHVDDLSAIVLTHSDLHHSGNTRELRADFEDATLYTSFSGSNPSPDELGMGESIPIEVGGTMDVAGRTFSFPWPTLSDRIQTTWIFDHESGTLFTADGFGNYHRPSACDHTTTELDGGARFADIKQFHADTLPWLKHADPESITDANDDLFERFDVEVVAPIHGNPILSASIDDYLADLHQAIRRIVEDASA